MSKVPVKREKEESPLVSAKSDEESSPPLKSSNKKARKNIAANRWTDEEWKLLYDLKQQGLSWSVIAGSFPGRTAHGVRLHYQNHIREETEVFSPEKVSYLREVTNFLVEELRKEYDLYEKRKLVNLANKVGMSAAGCKKALKEMGLNI